MLRAIVCTLYIFTIRIGYQDGQHESSRCHCNLSYLILSNLITSHWLVYLAYNLQLLWVYLLPPHTMQPFRSNSEVNGQRCSCGRTFDQPSAINKHKRTCSKTKKRLSSALELAREKWLGTSAKRRRIELAEPFTNHERCMPGLVHIQEAAEVYYNSQILMT